MIITQINQIIIKFQDEPENALKQGFQTLENYKNLVKSNTKLLHPLAYRTRYFLGLGGLPHNPKCIEAHLQYYIGKSYKKLKKNTEAIIHFKLARDIYNKYDQKSNFIEQIKNQINQAEKNGAQKISLKDMDYFQSNVETTNESNTDYLVDNFNTTKTKRSVHLKRQNLSPILNKKNNATDRENYNKSPIQRVESSRIKTSQQVFEQKLYLNRQQQMKPATKLTQQDYQDQLELNLSGNGYSGLKKSQNSQDKRHIGQKFGNNSNIFLVGEGEKINKFSHVDGKISINNLIKNQIGNQSSSKNSKLPVVNSNNNSVAFHSASNSINGSNTNNTSNPSSLPSSYMVNGNQFQQWSDSQLSQQSQQKQQIQKQSEQKMDKNNSDKKSDSKISRIHSLSVAKQRKPLNHMGISSETPKFRNNREQSNKIDLSPQNTNRQPNTQRDNYNPQLTIIKTRKQASPSPSPRITRKIQRLSEKDRSNRQSQNGYRNIRLQKIQDKKQIQSHHVSNQVSISMQNNNQLGKQSNSMDVRDQTRFALQFQTRNQQHLNSPTQFIEDEQFVQNSSFLQNNNTSKEVVMSREENNFSLNQSFEKSALGNQNKGFEDEPIFPEHQIISPIKLLQSNQNNHKNIKIQQMLDLQNQRQLSQIESESQKLIRSQLFVKQRQFEFSQSGHQNMNQTSRDKIRINSNINADNFVENSSNLNVNDISIRNSKEIGKQFSIRNKKHPIKSTFKTQYGQQFQQISTSKEKNRIKPQTSNTGQGQNDLTQFQDLSFLLNKESFLNLNKKFDKLINLSENLDQEIKDKQNSNLSLKINYNQAVQDIGIQKYNLSQNVSTNQYVQGNYKFITTLKEKIKEKIKLSLQKLKEIQFSAYQYVQALEQQSQQSLNDLEDYNNSIEVVMDLEIHNDKRKLSDLVEEIGNEEPRKQNDTLKIVQELIKDIEKNPENIQNIQKSNQSEFNLFNKFIQNL